MQNIHKDLNILLAVKKAQHKAGLKAAEIAAYLDTLGVKHQTVYVGYQEDAVYSLGKNFDAAFVFGGDGTMLELCRYFAGTNIPCLGINFGKVGFLSLVLPENAEIAVQKFLQGLFTTEKYMALNWKLIKGKKCLHQGIAVNDVVIARGAVARTVKLQININNENFSNLRADGLIISTALGSTAYAHSAGGPIIYPTANMLLLTSICTISGKFNPLVIESNSCIKIKNNTSAYESYLSIDGQEGPKLQNGEFLEISAIENHITMAIAKENWYLKRLKERNFIVGD